MTDGTHEIEMHDIRIAGIPNRHVVAKVQRISSPPVAVDAVADPRLSAISRLADVLRGDPSTRAHADFHDFKRRSREEPHAEWECYVAAVCRALARERLTPLALAPLPIADTCTAPSVTYHRAEMNGRDYVVARAGTILGGPAAVVMLADPALSALDRLADVLRAGEGSQCFTDFLAGRTSADVTPAWNLHGATVQAEQAKRNGVGAGRAEWIRAPDIIGGALYRFERRSPADRLRPGVMLGEGEVVRVIGGGGWSQFGGAVVQIVDRETGADLGVVSEASLRPL